MRHEITADVHRVHEVRHAELARERLPPGVHVDADDHVRADHARTLHDVETDPAQSEHDDIGARLDPGRIDHRTDAGRDAAADVADLLEWRVFANLRHGNFGEHGEVGEGRAP